MDVPVKKYVEVVKEVKVPQVCLGSLSWLIELVMVVGREEVCGESR